MSPMVAANWYQRQRGEWAEHLHGLLVRLLEWKKKGYWFKSWYAAAIVISGTGRLSAIWKAAPSYTMYICSVGMAKKTYFNTNIALDIPRPLWVYVHGTDQGLISGQVFASGSKRINQGRGASFRWARKYLSRYQPEVCYLNWCEKLIFRCTKSKDICWYGNPILNLWATISGV